MVVMRLCTKFRWCNTMRFDFMGMFVHHAEILLGRKWRRRQKRGRAERYKRQSIAEFTLWKSVQVTKLSASLRYVSRTLFISGLEIFLSGVG